jgi:hypothetical protein
VKSDRVIWITFFLILAVVLFLLFLVFGKKPEGPSIDPTSTPDFSELGDFEEDDISRPRQYQRRINIQGSARSTIKDDPEDEPETRRRTARSLATGAGSTKRSKRSKQFDSILAKYTSRSGPLPLNVKQDKLRKRLAEKGFKSNEYIEMRVMSLDRKPAEEAIRTAAKLVLADRDGEALELLKEQLANTDPQNLVVRGLLVQTILGFALDRGYPDTAMNFTRQLTAIKSRVNEIKMGTILMNSPIGRENLESERDAINKWQGNPEALTGGIEYLRDNNGYPPEVWRMIKGAGVNTSRQFSDPNARKVVPSAFKDLEDRVSRNWAKPKE